MLEVDLLRGGAKPQRRRAGPSWRHPRVRVPSVDPWTIGSGVTILASLGLAIHLALSVRGPVAALQESLDAALADSVRRAALAGEMRRLEARRDSIAARVGILGDIDARRYLWPRIMDEVAGVLPADAWLTSLAKVASPDDGVRFQVEGFTRDKASVTGFWNRMEASPFIREVRLVGTENAVIGSETGGSAQLHHFVLQAEPEDPPPEMLDLVSLPREVPE